MRRSRKHVVAAEKLEAQHQPPDVPARRPRSDASMPPKRNHYFPSRILQPGVQPVCPYRHSCFGFQC